MAGKPKPEGKRVTWSVKLSEADSDAADAARGQRTRSGYGRDAIIAAAGAKTRRRKPAAVPAEAEGERGDVCAHPKSRVTKGLCGACGKGGL